MNQFIRKPTIFCDIDGSLIEQPDGPEGFSLEAKALPGAVETINKWFDDGCCIVMTTARDDAYWSDTHNQLNREGFRYHRLLTGIGSNKRWVLNNTKDHSNDVAGTIIVEKNKGLENINIDPYMSTKLNNKKDKQ